MTTNDSTATIDQAVSMGYLSPLQASQLKEELSMFPISGSIVSHMVRKGILTLEQAQRMVDAQKDAQMGTSSSGQLQRPPTPPQGTPTAPQGTPGPGQESYRLQPARPNPSSPGLAGPATPKPRSVSEALEASRQAMQSAERSSAGLRPAGGVSPTPAGVPQQGVNRPVHVEAGPAGAQVSAAPALRELFQMGRERECSDLHLTIGKAPYLRQQGRLFFMPEAALTPATVKQLVFSVLSPEQQNILEQERQLDFSFEAPGFGRFRANVYYQRLGLEAAFRFIPMVVPTLKSLGFPSVLEKLTTYTQGLNLVTGPGGSGKTTTVAAMLEHINTHRHEHIITVEDPVEYVLTPKACQVTQREVGTHTNSFADALRTALRQDPDVIMIGELRDLETTSIAITAAETGHLVFSTLHTAGAVRTVARILDVYPPNQRQQICMMVAESLRGIISQQLLPRKDGQGRVCAMEILVVTTGVSQVIKEGKTHQLVSHMQSGRKIGMKSMDDALMELAQAGLITGPVAYAHADNKPAFEMMRNL